MMSGSDADSWRIAGRYIHDMGNGTSLTFSAMFENLSMSLIDVVDGVFGNHLVSIQLYLVRCYSWWKMYLLIVMLG